MLIDNSKKIVIKLGSTTVVDKNGKFKKIDRSHDPLIHL